MATKYHVRSISFPPRSHPTTRRIEDEIMKITSSLEVDSTTTRTKKSTLGLFCVDLSRLEELHSCLDDLLKLSSTQQVLSKYPKEKPIDLVLDSSIKVLDTCEVTRDSFSQLKEQIQSLNSSIRRKSSTIEENITSYICCRKQMKKINKKLITTLNKDNNNKKLAIDQDQDQHFVALIGVLNEVNSITTSIFKSLLTYLSLSKPSSPSSKWSIVAKLMHKGEESSESVDELLLLGRFDVEKIQRNGCEKLKALEMRIEEIEICLERLLRHLIRTRASLLNIISQ